MSDTSDTSSCEINELPDKPNHGENCSKREGQKDLEKSDESDTEGSDSDSSSVTTDSYEEDGDGNATSVWKTLIDFTKMGKKALYVANPESEDENSTDVAVNSEDENCLTNLLDQGKDYNHNTSILNSVSCVSPTSTYDLFEESNSVPFDDSDACTVVVADEPRNERSNDESPGPPLVESVEKESPHNLQANCKGLDCKKTNEDEAPKIFAKNVPLHPSETWDFSLQALDKDFKSKVLWVEGSFYQKFIGKCFHEMHNVPCECEEKKKISVCRLCHAVFCSNKCFKRAMKVQTGEPVDTNVGADEPELIPEEVKAEPKIGLKSNQYKQKGETKTCAMRTPASDKMYSKGCTPRDQPVKWETSERKKQIQPSPNGVTERREGRHYQHENSSPVPPYDKMWPTQVLLTSSNSNKLSQPITHERSPQRQNGIVNNFSNTCTKSQKDSEFGKYTGPNSRNFNWVDSKTENSTPVLDSQNEYIGTRAHTAVMKASSAKYPPVTILRNPILSGSEEEPKTFFNRRRTLSSSNSSSSNSHPKNRSEGGKDKYSEQHHRALNNPTANSEFGGTTNKTQYSSVGQSPQPQNENFSRSSYQLGKPHKNTEGRNVVPNGANQFSYNKTMERSGEPRQNRRDHHQPHNKYHRNTGSGTETYGKNQVMPFQHRAEDNFGTNRNQSSLPFNNQSSPYNENNNYKKHGSSRSDDVGNTGNKDSRRLDHFGQHTPSFVPKNRSVEGSTQQEFSISSSSSGYPRGPSSKSSIATSSSSNYTSRSIASVNQHSLEVHDNIGVPYQVLMTMKHVRGSDFNDFSVMTMRNWDRFKSLHSTLQTCVKVKMEICEVDNQCVVKYRAGDLEDSQEEWYRGVITKDVVSMFGIYLIDLGITTVVHRDAIHELRTPIPGQCSLGPLAVRVRALNVKVNNDVPDEVSERVEQFNTLVRERPVKIRITHKDTTESYKFGCNLHVQHIAKWFDAGVLMKKLLFVDQVTLDEIKREEELHQSIISCKKFLLHNEVLAAAENNSGKTKIKVTHVISPYEFYVATENSNKIMTDLENKLKDQRSVLQMKTVKSLKDLSYSMFLWDAKGNPLSRARVIVLEVSDNVNGIKVLIQKVDTGEILTVSMDELRKLPPNLQKPTSCAYKCSLPIKPVSKIQRNSILLFEEKATKNLEELKQLQTDVFLKVFSLDQQSNVHIVDLYLPTSKHSCASTFIKNGWAELSHNVDLGHPMAQNQKDE